MTSCQISLAAMRSFSRILRTVFLLFSQNKKSEVKVLLRKYKCGRPLKEESRSHTWLVI